VEYDSCMKCSVGQGYLFLSGSVI